MADSNLSFPPFLDRVIEFPDGSSYELLTPITDLRSCHDGTPSEARILFTCKLVNTSSSSSSSTHAAPPPPPPPASADNEYIMKVKVQEPNTSPASLTPSPGPSTTSAAELHALQRFRAANTPYAPQLVAWARAVQPPAGPLPGGYLTFLVMTKLPGDTLYKLQYWPMPEPERAAVVAAFVPALRAIYALGIEPTDRALRNILWDSATRSCAIIDFELWRETIAVFDDETKVLQGWGLARPPPARGWWEAWNQQGR